MGPSLEEQIEQLLNLINPTNQVLLEQWSARLEEAGGIYAAIDDGGRKAWAQDTVERLRRGLDRGHVTERDARRYTDAPPYRNQPLHEFLLASTKVGRMVRRYLWDEAPTPEVAEGALARWDPVYDEAIMRVVRRRQSRIGAVDLSLDVGRQLIQITPVAAAIDAAAGRIASEMDAELCLICTVSRSTVAVIGGSRPGLSLPEAERSELPWLKGIPNDRAGQVHFSLDSDAELEQRLYDQGLRSPHVRALFIGADLVGVVLLFLPGQLALDDERSEALESLVPVLAGRLGYTRATGELERADAALEDLFEASPNMLCALDPLGRIARTNRRFRAEIGMPGDVVGMPLGWLVHPSWIDAWDDLWALIEAEGSVRRERLDLLSADFRTVPLAIEAHWLRNRSVCMVALWNVAREIKQEQRIDELKAFAHHVAHDLKAPLRTVGAFTDLLLEEIPVVGEEAQDFADRIQAAVSRGNQLIDGVLRFAEAGEIEGQGEVVHLADLMEAMEEVIAGDLDARQAKLTVVADETPILGQPVALRTLLMNLVTNGLRYTEGDGPEVRISLRQSARAGWAELRVQDEGVGIPLAYQARIFDIFQRGETEQPGSGVGLAIVRRIAERHGGEVRLESAEGRGSTFIVTLPTP